MDQCQYGLDHLSDEQALALAQLVPLLWYGEQSAIQIFEREAKRLSTSHLQRVQSSMQAIAEDERRHERALAHLTKTLPTPTALATIHRRARCFYAQMSRTPSLAVHFGKIAQLDSAVCIIMHTLEQGIVGQAAGLKALFSQIKKDEARHIYISRNYAATLGLARKAYVHCGHEVREKLVTLLTPSGADFERLQVDLDRLLQRLAPDRA